MRSLLVRLAIAAVLLVPMTACSNGSGTSLPYAGPPNAAGGQNGGIYQSGANGQALLRVVNGSPDTSATSIDVCVDQTPLLNTSPSLAYGHASATLYSVPAGIGHTVSVYTTMTPGPGTTAGSQCATAPGPYFGASAIAFTTYSPAANTRETIVLGGTAASGTLGLYVYNDPTFVVQPTTAEAISHNAAPAYSKTQTHGVGFGQCTITVTPCATAVALAGASAVAAPKVSAPAEAVSNSAETSSIGTIPAGFYDGAGVTSGTPAPITSVSAPATIAGQPYIVQLYAVDAAAGGLNVVAFTEQSTGYGY